MTPAPIPADRPTDEAQHRRDMLSELIDIAMEVARAVGAQAVHEADVAVAGGGRAPDATAAFERAARVVRRTVLLAERLDQVGRSPGLRRTAARKRVIRAVEDAIGRQAADDAKAEGLHREFQERLDAPELDEALAAQAVPEIMHDLGLDTVPGAPPAMRRTPQDVAALCAWAAAPPGTPAAALPPLRPLPSNAAPRSLIDGGPHHASTIDRLLDTLPDDVSQWTDAQLEAAMAKAEYEARRSRGSG